MAKSCGRLLQRLPVSICIWLMHCSVFAIGAFAADALPPRNPLDVWIKETPWHATGTNELTAAHGRFYATSSGGSLYVSTNGVHWNRDLNVPGYWGAAKLLKEANGDVFAAFYGGTACWIRADGTFEKLSEPFVSSSSDIAYGSGIYLASHETTNAAESILLSVDGRNWTKQAGLPGRDQSLAFGNGRFVGVGRTGISFTTDNGATWQARADAGTNDLYAVVFGGGQFVAGGDGGMILTSTDGDTWTVQNSGVTNRVWGLCYGNGRFVAAAGRFAAESVDGVNWSNTNLSSQGIIGVAFGNGRYVGIRDYGSSASVDGMNWEHSVFSGITDVVGAAFWKGRTILGGRFQIWSTANRFTTNRSDWISTNNMRADRFAYNDSIIVSGYTDSNGNGAYSLDGMKWSRLSTPISDVLFDGNAFVSVSRSGSSRRSLDGIAWEREVPTGRTNALMSITYGNGTYVAGGVAGALFRSPDAQSWQPVESGVTNDIAGLGFGNGVFVATGDDGLILSSTNGSDWQRRDSHGSLDLSRPAYGHGYWAVVGSKHSTNIILSLNDSVALFSTNGVDWEISRTKPEQPLFDVIATTNGFYAVGMGNFRSGHFGPPSFGGVNAAPSVELGVQGHVGKTYLLESIENIGSTAWQEVGRFLQTNNVQKVVPPAVGESRFYRLVEP